MGSGANLPPANPAVFLRIVGVFDSCSFFFCKRTLCWGPSYRQPIRDLERWSGWRQPWRLGWGWLVRVIEREGDFCPGLLFHGPSANSLGHVESDIDGSNLSEFRGNWGWGIDHAWGVFTMPLWDAVIYFVTMPLFDIVNIEIAFLFGRSKMKCPNFIFPLFEKNEV